MLTRSITRFAFAASMAAMGLLAGCASTATAVAKVDTIEAKATASKQEALAAEYQRLAARERALSRSHQNWADQKRQSWAVANQGRTVKSAADPMDSHCAALAGIHARAAEEHAALAERHLSLARARRG